MQGMQLTTEARGIRVSGAGVPSPCEAPDMGAGT